MVGVSTSEIEAVLQKAARLRGQVEKLELEALRRRTFAGRVFSFFIGFLTCVVIAVLAVDGWLAYDAFRHEAPRSGTTVGGPTYSDLEVLNESGVLTGQVSITNPFSRDIDVLVDVDLYDGDQAVGELSGMVTLRPDSTSVVELRGGRYVDFTESRVHLSGWPVSLAQGDSSTK